MFTLRRYPPGPLRPGLVCPNGNPLGAVSRGVPRLKSSLKFEFGLGYDVTSCHFAERIFGPAGSKERLHKLCDYLPKLRGPS